MDGSHTPETQGYTEAPLQKPKSDREKVAEAVSAWTEFASSFDSIGAVAAWILTIGLIIVLCYIAWLNVAPYVAFIEGMTGQVNKNWLANIPPIRGIIAAASMVVTTAVGFLLWIVVQTLQCLWFLVRLDRKALQGSLKQQQMAAKYAPDHASDDKETKAVKRHIRRIPTFFIRNSGYLAIGAYTFDLVIGWSMFPPAESAGAFLSALMLGNLARLDLANIARLSAMLLGFEVCLWLAMISWQWLQARKLAEDVEVRHGS